MELKRKALVIGIDGGTFDIIMPLIKEGHLPNLSSIVNNGSFGKLLSTIPPVTAPAWSSFIMGTNPANHGVFYFFDRDINNYDLNGSRTLMNLRNMKGIPFWRVINKHGGKAGLVNIPLTYPPDKVDSFMISGMLVPKGAADYIYPLQISAKLENYQVDLDGLMVDNQWRGKALVKENRDKFIENIYNLSKARAQNSLRLMKETDWDLFMTVFVGSDRISHFFWRDQKTKEAPSKIVKDYYIYLDSLLGDLLAQAGDVAKIIISDHGFGAAPGKTINLYALMKELGHTVFEDGKFKYLKNKILNQKEKQASEDYINWNLSKLYSVPLYGNFLGICVNTKGEKKQGIVSQGEYNSLRDEVIEKLEKLADSSGKRLVTRAYKREEIYSGQFLNSAPDIIAEFDYDYNFGFNPWKSLIRERPANFIRTGDHRREGIFMASGLGIKKGELEKNLYLEDITSTLLYLLDIPIPDTYQGKIADIFSNDYLADNPPRHEKIDGLDNNENEVNKDEFEKSKELLKNLGYM